MAIYIYRKISNISHTKSLHLNNSRLVLHLSLPNPLKPVVSREWRCSWSSADRWCSNYISVIHKFIAYLGVAYIRGLTVSCNKNIQLYTHDPSQWYHLIIMPSEIANNSAALNRFFRHSANKTSKLNITGPLWGESTITGGFPSQRHSNAENISMSWSHHEHDKQPWIISMKRNFSTSTWY